MSSIIRADKWQNALGVAYNSVLQVVSVAHQTQTATTSASFVSTNLEATITPKFASSKILVIARTTTGHSNGSNSVYTLYRGTASGTNLGNGNDGMSKMQVTYPNVGITEVGATYLDSPNTTSAQQYTFAFRSTTAGQTVTCQYGNSQGQITLLEIAQ